MGLFNLFKKKEQNLSDDELKWNKMWDLWTEGKVKSPYAEVMTYQSQVNNGGHSQFFFNVSNTDDVHKVMDQLRSVLSEELKRNLEEAYRANFRLEENEEDEEAESILEACDDLFYERESEVIAILEQYAMELNH